MRRRRHRDRALRGRAVDGTEFDESWSRGSPSRSRTWARYRVIPGWNEGLVGAKIGERRRLEIGANKAYGAAGNPRRSPPTPRWRSRSTQRTSRSPTADRRSSSDGSAARSASCPSIQTLDPPAPSAPRGRSRALVVTDERRALVDQHHGTSAGQAGGCGAACRPTRCRRGNQAELTDHPQPHGVGAATGSTIGSHSTIAPAAVPCHHRPVVPRRHQRIPQRCSYTERRCIGDLVGEVDEAGAAHGGDMRGRRGHRHGRRP